MVVVVGAGGDVVVAGGAVVVVEAAGIGTLMTGADGRDCVVVVAFACTEPLGDGELDAGCGVVVVGEAGSVVVVVVVASQSTAKRVQKACRALSAVRSSRLVSL